jgi:hypothetical protein
MHEINTAAETITNAADSDANILFGATINPDLEGEVIITVVATGFDASYFSKRQAVDEMAPSKTDIKEDKPATVGNGDDVMSDLDMSLDNHQPATDFKSESPMANIWTIDDDKHQDLHDDVVVSNMDDELEKPSFLRRLTKRNQQKDTPDDDSGS